MTLWSAMCKTFRRRRLWLAWRVEGERLHDSKLLQEPEQISHAPVRDDLAVADTHDVDGVEAHLLAAWLSTHERAVMGAAVRFVRCDAVPVAELKVDLSAEVGEDSAEGAIKSTRAVLGRREARLRRVVDVVLGEESVEQSEVAFALNLLGVAADHPDGFELLTHSDLSERGRCDTKPM